MALTENEELRKMKDNRAARDLLDQHIAKLFADKTLVFKGVSDVPGSTEIEHLTVVHLKRQIENLNKGNKKTEFDGTYLQRNIENIIQMMPEKYDLTLEQVQAAIDGTGHIEIAPPYGWKCRDCDAPLMFALKKNFLIVAGTRPCENNRYYTVDVPFPTGEVIAQDWCDGFDEMEEAGIIAADDVDDGIKADKFRSEGMAAAGILHMFVGNSCPQVFFNKTTNEIIVGCKPSGKGKEAFKGFRQINSICTDLWWASLVDKQTFENLHKKLPEGSPLPREYATGKVKPGTYRFTSYFDTDSYDNPVYIKGVLL